MMYKTIAQLHRELRDKVITTLDILKVSHEKINQTKNLNAYTLLYPYSKFQAQYSQNYFDKDEPRSILEGIPIAVKDNFCVKNVTTSCGSNMLKNFKPKYTATVVDKLFKSGAVVIGKTNMDEFAMGSGTIASIYGPTKNIWGSNIDKRKKTETCDSDWFICGGSSGGSAVAVASGTCLGALGSDTGGSTRNPASYCGIVGYKPTYGLFSRHGLIPLVNSMDVPGILTNNVEDAYVLLKIMAGQDEKDSTTVKTEITRELNLDPSVKGMKIGIPLEYNCKGLSEEVKETWKKISKILENGGATLTTVSMPFTKYSIVCYSVLNQCEVASNMAKYDGVEFGTRSSNTFSTEHMFADTRSSNLNLTVRRRILAGNYFLLGSNYGKYFVKAMKVRRLIANDFLTVWNKGCDVLLTPTTLTDAPKYSDFIKSNEREQCAKEDYCTQPANLAGCPAVSVPTELSCKGLPLSIQLMAPNFEDQKMLEVARYIEKEVRFNEYRQKYL